MSLLCIMEDVGSLDSSVTGCHFFIQSEIREIRTLLYVDFGGMFSKGGTS